MTAMVSTRMPSLEAVLVGLAPSFHRDEKMERELAAWTIKIRQFILTSNEIEGVLEPTHCAGCTDAFLIPVQFTSVWTFTLTSVWRDWDLGQVLVSCKFTSTNRAGSSGTDDFWHLSVALERRFVSIPLIPHS